MNKNEKSIIERLLRIEQILRLRREEHSRLNEYNAGEVRHEKQLEFHRCAKRNRWILGGNRSGKTEAGSVESLWMALGRHPFRKNKKNITGWVVSVSYEVQREVAQNKILHYLSPSCIEDITMKSGSKGSPRSGIIDTIAVRNIFGGVSRIVFKSADQGREKFQGASVDFVWFDEEPPQDIYQECRMRIMDTKGDIFGTMTPLKGLTFVYEEIFLNKRLDPEIQCFHMEWADIGCFTPLILGETSQLLVNFNNFRGAYTGMIDDSGTLFGTPLKKLWQSPRTSLLRPDADKIIRRIYLKADAPLTITVGEGEDGEETVIEAEESHLIQTLFLSQKCQEVCVKLEWTRAAKFYLNGFLIEFDIIKRRHESGGQTDGGHTD